MSHSKTVTQEKRCVGEAWTTGNFPRQYRCSHRGKVQRAGGWYCGTHDPDAIAVRKAERDAKYAAEQAADLKKWSAEAELKRRGRAYLDLYAALEADLSGFAKIASYPSGPAVETFALENLARCKAALSRARGESV